MIRCIFFTLALASSALVAHAAVPPVAHAQEAIRGDLEAALHLKLLSYDRAFIKRSGSRLVIGVVYKAGDANSERVRADIGDAFQRLSKKVTVLGVTPQVVMIPYDQANLGKALQDAGVTVVYVAAGLEDALPTVIGAAARLKAPTMTRRFNEVKGGLAIGVVPSGGKPKLVINLRSASATGMDLDPKILRLADVLK